MWCRAWYDYTVSWKEKSDLVWHDKVSKCYRNIHGERVTRKGGMQKNDVLMPPFLPSDVKTPERSVLNMRRRINEKQSMYLDWLLSQPETRKPTTRKAWGKKHGVGYAMLLGWECDDTFLREWNRRVNEIGFSPDKHAKVVAALYKAATDADLSNVTAMNKWLDRRDTIMPTEKEEAPQNNPSLSDLPDDELFELLEVLRTEHEQEAAKRKA